MAPSQYTDVEDQIIYGLDKVDSGKEISVNLKDLLYVHNTIGELIRYLHQPTHYPTFKAVLKFIGNTKRGAFKPLAECYYKKLSEVWPDDIVELMEDGTFDNPISPFYYSEDLHDLED